VQSRFGWMVYSAKRTWSYLERALGNKQHCIMVAVQDDQLVGLLTGFASQYPFCNEFSVQIDVLYVIPSLRGSRIAMQLLVALKKWAHNRDAAEIWVLDRFGSSDGRTAKLLTKLGMPTTGGLHSMWVDRQ
jgi:GNAT superfamily N-acetyltransferase